MTADLNFTGQPRVTRLIQTSFLLLVGAAATLLMAANHGNRVLLGLVAWAAIPAPAICYVYGRLCYWADRRRVQKAAVRYLRLYIDAEKTVWRQPATADTASQIAQMQHRYRRQVPPPIAGFRNMDARIAPCVPDPVLIVFEAILQRPKIRVAVPQLPEEVTPGEWMKLATAKPKPESAMSGLPWQFHRVAWMDARPWMAQG